ncbi:MAG TPA: urease accessory UreF family protein [Polyangiaceae bacterium]
MADGPALAGSGIGAVLGALRLGSAALPIGAFAYSQALEQAVEVGLVRDARTASSWIRGILRSSILSGDVPVLVRLRQAWLAGRDADVRSWSDWLYATRATRELREEERQLGGALFRLLARLGEARAVPFQAYPRATLASSFALSAVRWGLSAELSALSYCFAWTEAQVGAATRLIPLGQSAAQAILSEALSDVESGLAGALERSDDDIVHTAPGQSLLSAAHETQYSRLFRS